MVSYWNRLLEYCLNFKRTQRDSTQSLQQPHLYLFVYRTLNATSTTRVKHQILTSSNKESSNVELEDQQLSQVFQTDVRVSDSDDATCICKDLWNIKPTAPHLSQHLPWIRVCPNAEHHQQSVACYSQLDFIRFPMLFRPTQDRYLEAFWAEASAR